MASLLCVLRWKKISQIVGRISQPFRLKLEFLQVKAPSHAAVDNIRLDSCLTGSFFFSCCPVYPFQCATCVRTVSEHLIDCIHVCSNNGIFPLEMPMKGNMDGTRRDFQCNDGRYLPRNQVCDISKDCPGGEDEEQDCGT